MEWTDRDTALWQAAEAIAKEQGPQAATALLVTLTFEFAQRAGISKELVHYAIERGYDTYVADRQHVRFPADDES